MRVDLTRRRGLDSLGLLTLTKPMFFLHKNIKTLVQQSKASGSFASVENYKHTVFDVLPKRYVYGEHTTEIGCAVGI